MNQTSGLTFAAVASVPVEPGRHDDVEALVQTYFRMLRDPTAVRAGVTKGPRRRCPDGGGRLLGARVRIFVEVLVVDFADVRCDADLDLRRVGREGYFVPGACGAGAGLAPPTRRPPSRRGRAGGAATRGDDEGQSAEQRQAQLAGAHVSSSSIVVTTCPSLTAGSVITMDRYRPAHAGRHWRASYRRGTARASQLPGSGRSRGRSIDGPRADRFSGRRGEARGAARPRSRNGGRSHGGPSRYSPGEVVRGS